MNDPIDEAIEVVNNISSYVTYHEDSGIGLNWDNWKSLPCTKHVFKMFEIRKLELLSLNITMDPMSVNAAQVTTNVSAFDEIHACLEQMKSFVSQ